MSEKTEHEIGFGRGRRPVRLTAESLVETSTLDETGRPPLVVTPRQGGLVPARWAAGRREWVEGELLRHGALLFRGFNLSGPEQFAEFARALSPELLDYFERAAPRIEVGPNIYTSTEYPADQSIPLHHEMSYSHNWPTKLWFYCAQPARAGGATPITPDREVFDLIDPAVRRRFAARKVMYVRNYGEGLDLSWQEAFQTDDRAAVETYCRQAHMSCEWRAGDRLRTRAVRQVVATHPRTGETVWFNHAHMFHISNVAPATRAALLAQYRDDELPRNAFYGDGSPIEDSVLEEIRRVYRETAIRFEWRHGDVLMLDNFLVSHGRDPFQGPRQVLVAMAELYTNADFS